MNLKTEPIYIEKVDNHQSHNVDNIIFIYSILFILFLIILIFYDILIDKLDPRAGFDYKILFLILIFLILVLMFRIKYKIIYPSFPIKLYQKEIEFPILWIERIYKQMKIPYKNIDEVEISNRGIINDIKYSSITLTTNKGRKYYSGIKKKEEIEIIHKILIDKGLKIENDD